MSGLSGHLLLSVTALALYLLSLIAAKSYSGSARMTTRRSAFLLVGSLAVPSAASAFLWGAASTLSLEYSRFAMYPIVLVFSFLYAATQITVFGARTASSLVSSLFLEVGSLLSAPVGLNADQALLAVAAFSVIPCLFLLRMRSIRVGGVSGGEALTAFGTSWMEPESLEFDNLSEAAGSNSVVSVSALIFRSDSQRIASLIIPYIHPGPARGMGSGDLPSVLTRELNEFGPVVLHGASNHAHNLASRKSTLAVVAALKAELGRARTGVPVTHVIHRDVSDSKYSVASYSFGSSEIVFASKVGNTEDLPTLVCQLRSSTRDLVDRHNGLCNEHTALFSELQGHELAGKIQALSAASEEHLVIKSVGSSRVTLQARDVGPGGVSAVVLNGDKSVVFVCVDGNNMVCGLAEQIRSALSRAGFAYVEVLTTDNHWNSGNASRGLGYLPVGTVSREPVVRACLEAARTASSTSQPAILDKIKVEVSVRVLGEGFLSELLAALSRGIRALTLVVVVAAVTGIVLAAI